MRRIATTLFAAGALAVLVPASASAAFGPVGSFGGSGSGNGQFNLPHAAAAGNSTLYVADTANSRIEYFSLGGAFQGVLGGGPAAPTDVAVAPNTDLFAVGAAGVVHWVAGIPLFSWTPPGTSYGVAVDPSGSVYVSDAQNGVIRKFDGIGNLQGTIGAPGTGPGQLLQPQGLAEDASGSLYVADPGNGKVVKYTATGFQEFAMPAYTIVEGDGSTVTGRIEPHDVAVDGSGRVFVPDAGPHSNLVAMFGFGGDLEQLLGSPDTDPGSPCRLRSPWGVATSAPGGLYVVSTGENRIRVFDEVSGSCPAPNFGAGGGLSGAETFGGPGAGDTAGAHGDRSKPKIKLLGFPHHCARQNFSFQVHVTDDTVIKTLELFVNGNRAAKQKPDQAEWNVKVRMPVATVRREIPKGSRVKVTVEVKVRDASGKKARLKRAFQICG